MFHSVVRIALLLCLTILASCETTDSTLRSQGHSESYLQGFHDGRHSGMKEAGNSWEHYVRDHERFDSDTEYRDGWMAGEVEGKHLQEQAKAIGDSMAGSYTGYRVGKEVDKNKPDANKAAQEAMKGVDTSDLKSLEK